MKCCYNHDREYTDDVLHCEVKRYLKIPYGRGEQNDSF